MYKALVTLATGWGVFPKGAPLRGVPPETAEQWVAAGVAARVGGVETAEAAPVEQAVSQRGRRRK